MADADLKRSRADFDEELETESKRQKSYGHILSLLEADHEDETSPDLSSLVTTLQEVISNGSAADAASEGGVSASDSSSSSPVRAGVGEEDPGEGSVLMRHLLEASDDELGIPSSETEYRAGDIGGGGDFNYEGDFPFCGGLWEFEDEAANYYTLLQSELFMEL